MPSKNRISRGAEWCLLLQLRGSSACAHRPEIRVWVGTAEILLFFYFYRAYIPTENELVLVIGDAAPPPKYRSQSPVSSDLNRYDYIEFLFEKKIRQEGTSSSEATSPQDKDWL